MATLQGRRETIAHLPSRGKSLALDEFFDETENHARSRSERLRENSGTSISSPEIIVGGALRSPTQPIDTMLKFTEMDFNVTLIQQMEADISPVVLINRFTVTPEEVDQLLKAWAADAAFLKTQPGCIFRSASPWHRRQLLLYKRRCVGVSRALQAGVHAPKLPGSSERLPAKHSGVAATFRESSNPQYLCRRMNALPARALQRTGNGGLL